MVSTKETIDRTPEATKLKVNARRKKTHLSARWSTNLSIQALIGPAKRSLMPILAVRKTI